MFLSLIIIIGQMVCVSYVICMLTLLLLPLAGLHFCVGPDFVIPSRCNLCLVNIIMIITGQMVYGSFRE
jgi:hypothetical protein